MNAVLPLPRPRSALLAAARARPPLAIGLLCPHDLTDRNAFSGTARFAAEALAARPGLEVRLMGGPKRRGRLARLFSGPVTLPEPRDFDGLDAVVGLVATRLVPSLPVLPYLHVTDATPAFLRETYGRPVPADAEDAERRAALHAHRVVYSSAAMAARAPRDLGLPDLDPAVLPFGVNFEHLPDAQPVKPPLERPRLLFVGKDWRRKGGDRALALLARLRHEGFDATLTVVGDVPKGLRPRPGLRVVGYLDKNRVTDASRLSQLYAEAHLLVLPTRGDCTPMVMAEAMAHGTPVIVTDTGGTADVLGGEGTGRVLPPDAGTGAWATAVKDALASRTGYAFLSDGAFERAHNALVWSAWADGIAVLAAAAAGRLGPEAGAEGRLSA